jgi:hypothetical protein
MYSLFNCWSFALAEQKITVQKLKTIGLHRPFQNKRTSLCFSFLETIKSSTYAKLPYATLKLIEVYIEFFIGSCSMHNGKPKIIFKTIEKCLSLPPLACQLNVE